MRLIAISDPHVQSALPHLKVQTTPHDSKWSKPYEATCGNALHECYAGRNIPRPGITVTDFKLISSTIARVIKKMSPDLVLFLGDMFNKSTKIGRDMHHPEDVQDALTRFVDEIDSPVACTIGNGEVYLSDDFCDSVNRTMQLNRKLNEVSDEIEPITDKHGNLALQRGNTAVILLNSLGPFNYPAIYPGNVNEDFLDHALTATNSQNIIVGTHHPPFPFTFDSGFMIPYAQAFIPNTLEVKHKTERRKSLILSGHYHENHIWSNGQGVTGRIIAPSMQPVDDSITIGYLVESNDCYHGNWTIKAIRSQFAYSILNSESLQ